MAARSSRRQRPSVVLLRTTALSIIAVAAMTVLIVTSSMTNYSKLQSSLFVVINNNNNIQNAVIVHNVPTGAASRPSSVISNQTTTLMATNSDENRQENSEQQQQEQQHQQVVRLEFVHIPKTGGTSIEKAALASRYKIRWGIKQIVTRSNRTHRRAASLVDLMPYWHAPPTYFRDPTFDPYGPNIFENATLFTVVRNPYARAVSEYQYWFRDVKRQPNVLYNNVDHMNAWLDGMLQPLYDVLKKKKKEKNSDTASTTTTTSNNGGVTDDEYKTIDTSNQWRHWRNQTDAFRAAYYANLGHFIPQYDFVYDGLSPQPIIHHVLKFENLANEFHALMHQYNLTGIRIADTKLQKTQTLKRLRQQVSSTAAAVMMANNNNNNNDIDKNATLVAAAATAAAELAQYTTRPKVAGVPNLTLANRQLIQDIYARDFVAFGYKI